MIRGVVTRSEGIVQLSVFGKRGQRETIAAIVDTGYDGALTLPPTLIRELELRWISFGDATLADGSEIEFDVHEGEILWDRRRVLISIDSSDATPLIGMQLLEGFELTMQVREEGPVLIKRMKPPSKKRRRR
ncbi:MAG: clan AA aspartic protease [Planctomycetaceae bacterium]